MKRIFLVLKKIHNQLSGDCCLDYICRQLEEHLFSKLIAILSRTQKLSMVLIVEYICLRDNLF